MLFELLIVFLIIAFSYIFKIADKSGMDKQLTFICLTFILIITYKMLYYYRLRKNLNHIASNNNTNETFFDFSKEVNEFVSAGVPEGISTANIQQYKEELNKLQEQVGVMNEYLNEMTKIAKGEGENQAASRLDEINIQANQQIQDYRIKQLQQEIEQTTDLIKKAKLREDAKSFRKIPVYSSCVVSNADGSFTVDTPNPTPTTTSTGSGSGSGAGSGAGSGSGSTNTTVAGAGSGAGSGAGAGSGGLTNVPSGVEPGNTSSGFNLADLINKIQTNGLTINLDTTN